MRQDLGGPDAGEADAFHHGARRRSSTCAGSQHSARTAAGAPGRPCRRPAPRRRARRPAGVPAFGRHRPRSVEIDLGRVAPQHLREQRIGLRRRAPRHARHRAVRPSPSVRAAARPGATARRRCATPCWASAITSSSRKAPWPIRIWRPKGSVSGSRRSRSVRRVITPGFAQVHQPGLQVVRVGRGDGVGHGAAAQVGLAARGPSRPPQLLPGRRPTGRRRPAWPPWPRRRAAAGQADEVAAVQHGSSFWPCGPVWLRIETDGSRVGRRARPRAHPWWAPLRQCASLPRVRPVRRAARAPAGPGRASAWRTACSNGVCGSSPMRALQARVVQPVRACARGSASRPAPPGGHHQADHAQQRPGQPDLQRAGPGIRHPALLAPRWRKALQPLRPVTVWPAKCRRLESGQVVARLRHPHEAAGQVGQVGPGRGASSGPG